MTNSVIDIPKVGVQLLKQQVNTPAHLTVHTGKGAHATFSPN